MLDGLLAGFLAIVVTVIVVGVVVPLTICYLVARSVFKGLRRRRWQQSARTFPRAQRGQGWTPPVRGGRPLPPAPMVGRQWSVLLADAAAARERFRHVVDDCRPGPLRHSLEAAMGEVDAAVGEAHRLAEQGSRTERAHRDVLAALEAQRRRRRRTPSLSPDLEDSIAEATRAQHASAERLAAASRRDLTQLQLVVARLHELTAHALEISTTTTAVAELPATSSIADRLAALRLATAEVAEVTRA